MIIPTRLKEAMLAKGHSPASLARAIGVTGPAISNILNGTVHRTKFTPEIARELEVSVRWLLGETDDASPDAIALPSAEELADQFNLARVREVDIQYTMGGGSFIEHHPNERWRHFDIDWLREITPSAAELLHVARGIGDSMMPTLLDNDTLLIDRGQRVINLQDRIWSIAYGELAMIKRVRRQPTGRYLIISDNPAVDNFEASDDELFVIGRIVWVGRKT